MDKDLEFQYKDIKIILLPQIEAIVSSVKINHRDTSNGIKLELTWE